MQIIEKYCHFWDGIAGYRLDYLQIFTVSILVFILAAVIVAFLMSTMRISGMEERLLIILWKFFWSILQSLIVTLISSGRLFLKNFKFFWKNEKKGTGKGKWTKNKSKRGKISGNF